MVIGSRSEIKKEPLLVATNEADSGLSVPVWAIAQGNDGRVTLHDMPGQHLCAGKIGDKAAVRVGPAPDVADALGVKVILVLGIAKPYQMGLTKTSRCIHDRIQHLHWIAVIHGVGGRC